MRPVPDQGHEVSPDSIERHEAEDDNHEAGNEESAQRCHHVARQCHRILIAHTAHARQLIAFHLRRIIERASVKRVMALKVALRNSKSNLRF